MLLRFAALEEIAPVVRLDLDVELLCRCTDPLPRAIAFGVADALDLVEARNGVADVAGVAERFLPFLGERECCITQPVLLSGAHPLRAAGNLGTVHAGTLHLAGLLDVAPGRLFPLSRCHVPT